MSKILAIDYGTKRVGFAISDNTKTFAFGLSTQENKNSLAYIKQLVPKEKIEVIVIGIPKTLQNEMAEIVPKIRIFVEKIRQDFPGMRIIEVDERFSSKMAFQSMIDSGLKKKDRQNKALVDEISATLLLQNYLETFTK
jgi:putative Holliday junction resolvase